LRGSKISLKREEKTLFISHGGKEVGRKTSPLKGED
jgi:hypothetical protein